MAHRRREDNVEPRSLQLPLLLRATFEFGHEGAQTEARRPKKKKRNRKKQKEREEKMAWRRAFRPWARS